MKHVVFMAVSLCALFGSATSRADTVDVSAGVDSAATLGEHIGVEAVLNPNWNLGLELGQHHYRTDAKDVTETIATQEIEVIGRHQTALTTNVALYQTLAVGQVRLPSDASQDAYNVIDLGTGLRLTTGKMFTDIGLGLRDNLITKPVRIGPMGGVGQQFALYPTVSVGMAF